MKKRAVIGGVAAVALLLASVYFWGPSAVPPGQEALTILSPGNLSEFAAAFDADSGLLQVFDLLA